jgi:hypothetical protein
VQYRAGAVFFVAGAAASLFREARPVLRLGHPKSPVCRFALGELSAQRSAQVKLQLTRHWCPLPEGEIIVTGLRQTACPDYCPNGHCPNGQHYAVGAYYAGGPWYGYSGWSDYAARNAISCTPGTMVKLEDGLMHVCQ